MTIINITTRNDIPGFITQARRLDQLEEYARSIAQLSEKFTDDKLKTLTFNIETTPRLTNNSSNLLLTSMCDFSLSQKTIRPHDQ